MFRYYASDQQSASAPAPTPVRERRPTPRLDYEILPGRAKLKEARAFVEPALLPEHPGISAWFEQYWDYFCSDRPVITVRVDGKLSGVLIARIDEKTDAKCSMIVVPEERLRMLLRAELFRMFENAADGRHKHTKHMNALETDRVLQIFLEFHGYERRHPFPDTKEIPGRLWYPYTKRPLPKIG